MKIVSHCWKRERYKTPNGRSKQYNQLQVVTDTGQIFALVLRYHSPFSDAHIVEEWQELAFQPLPESQPHTGVQNGQN